MRALDMVDLDVNRGEAVAVMGPSGCGKSTLLHLIGGLDRPSAGQLSVAGHRVDELSERALAHLRRDEIGFVFQAFQLMDELTAQENVELPALLAGYSPNQARARATALLEQVGLADRARHLPPMLSGGQRQRVAIARALVNDPGIVLADEPTGNLGSASAFDVLSAAAGLARPGSDAGDRHPRRADRDDRGPLDLDARRSVCRRDAADGRFTRAPQHLRGVGAPRVRSKENLMNQPRRARRAGRVKGRALLLFRLARQDIRHHFAQALLLVAAIAVATATITMAFALNGVNTNPYQQTKAATKGPDIVAQSANDPYTSVTSPADLAALVALNHAKGASRTSSCPTRRHARSTRS